MCAVGADVDVQLLSTDVVLISNNSEISGDLKSHVFIFWKSIGICMCINL